MTPHLYPARPGMLRRGTPVVTMSEAVGTVERCDEHGWIITEHSTLSRLMYEDCNLPEWMGSCGLGDYYTSPSRWWLDLRDPTARAHAAMAYTRVGSPAVVECDIDTGVAVYWRTVLRRMRMLDESVTVAEARAALDWAHAASGGGE